MRKPRRAVSKKTRKSSRAVAYMRIAKQNNRGAISAGKIRPLNNRNTASPRNGKRYSSKHAGSLHRQVIVRVIEIVLPATFRKDGTQMRGPMLTNRQIKKIVNHTNNV